MKASIYVCAGFTGHGMPTTYTRLAAKAAVEIMLGETEVDLPRQYGITGERLQKAKQLEGCYF